MAALHVAALGKRAGGKVTAWEDWAITCPNYLGERRMFERDRGVTRGVIGVSALLWPKNETAAAAQNRAREEVGLTILTLDQALGLVQERIYTLDPRDTAQRRTIEQSLEFAQKASLRIGEYFASQNQADAAAIAAAAEKLARSLQKSAWAYRHYLSVPDFTLAEPRTWLAPVGRYIRKKHLQEQWSEVAEVREQLSDLLARHRKDRFRVAERTPR